MTSRAAVQSLNHGRLTAKPGGLIFELAHGSGEALLHGLAIAIPPAPMAASPGAGFTAVTNPSVAGSGFWAEVESFVASRNGPRSFLASMPSLTALLFVLALRRPSPRPEPRHVDA
jgi:hypothetical protein